MEVTKQSRLKLKLQNWVFILLFLVVVGLLAYLSTRYNYRADWTAGGRNTLAEASVQLLDAIEGEVRITSYATDNKVLRKQIEELIDRYRRHKPDLVLSFVNPDEEPQRTRELGISVDGELVIAYQGREERVEQLAEQPITNALQRVARGGERWIVFVTGHGERSPEGKANHDYGSFSAELMRKGMKVRTLNLAKEADIPANTTTLVVAGPRTDLLPGEVKLIERYVADGGNLLWLGDPGELHGLQPLADRLGVLFLPGMVVDASTQLFGISNPSFALVADYPPNPVTGNFGLLTIFPQAAALEFEEGGEWQVQPILQTLERSWTETADLKGEIRYDEGTEERPGPLTLGAILTRTPGKAAGEGEKEEGDKEEEKGAEQRVMVVGDGDFLSNAYLGNGGNLDLGLSLFQWLGHDDRFIDVPAKTAPDTRLQLSQTGSILISAGFLFILPLGLVVAGVAVWWRRRRR